MKNKYNFYSKIERCLVGKELSAFGKDGNGYWGMSEKIHKFGVEELNIEGGKDSILIDIIFNKHSATKYKRFEYIYTDETFIKDVRKHLKKIGIKPNDVDYTEQGMQGVKFVNIEINNVKNYL